MQEPLRPTEARSRIRRILEEGCVLFSRHANEEMGKDNLSAEQCIKVLRGGVVEPAEWEHGSWRYRVHTASVWVVVAFRSEIELVVVTAWRAS